MIDVFLWLIFGYFLGSIPFGVILTRAGGYGDIRKMGSGNIGATNVLRTGNKILAALTLLLDFAKGGGAVLLFHLFGPLLSDSFLMTLAIGTSACIGHIFPLWLGFKGGKGVATFLGFLCVSLPISAFVFIVVWIGTAVITRRSSAGAIVALISSFLSSFLIGPDFLIEHSLCLMAIITLILYKHQGNISRLMAGTEPKIGQKEET